MTDNHLGNKPNLKEREWNEMVRWEMMVKWERNDNMRSEKIKIK